MFNLRIHENKNKTTQGNNQKQITQPAETQKLKPKHMRRYRHHNLTPFHHIVEPQKNNQLLAVNIVFISRSAHINCRLKGGLFLVT